VDKGDRQVNPIKCGTGIQDHPLYIRKNRTKDAALLVDTETYAWCDRLIIVRAYDGCIWFGGEIVRRKTFLKEYERMEHVPWVNNVRMRLWFAMAKKIWIPEYDPDKDTLQDGKYYCDVARFVEECSEARIIGGPDRLTVRRREGPTMLEG
jgi:hypothetical protein